MQNIPNNNLNNIPPFIPQSQYFPQMPNSPPFIPQNMYNIPQQPFINYQQPNPYYPMANKAFNGNIHRNQFFRE